MLESTAVNTKALKMLNIKPDIKISPYKCIIMNILEESLVD